MSVTGATQANIPVDIVDGIEDVRHAVRCLVEVLECVNIAVASPTHDSADYIKGTLSVLLQATEALSSEVQFLEKAIQDEARVYPAHLCED